MIGKLKGQIEQIHVESIILDVNGVGYLIYCSNKTLQNIQIGQTCSLFIETLVREDSIKLFGFINNEEKDIFLLLQSVNGVGAKMSLNIISTISIDDLHQAISSRNKNLLVTVPGVGTKIAERIIIELKGKKIFSHNLPNQNISFSTDFHDAVLGLISLGINKNQAHACVEQILMTNPDAKIDDIIRLALTLCKTT